MRTNIKIALNKLLHNDGFSAIERELLYSILRRKEISLIEFFPEYLSYNTPKRRETIIEKYFPKDYESNIVNILDAISKSQMKNNILEDEPVNTEFNCIVTCDPDNLRKRYIEMQDKMLGEMKENTKNRNKRYYQHNANQIYGRYGNGEPTELQKCVLRIIDSSHYGTFGHTEQHNQIYGKYFNPKNSIIGNKTHEPKPIIRIHFSENNNSNILEAMYKWRRIVDESKKERDEDKPSWFVRSLYGSGCYPEFSLSFKDFLLPNINIEKIEKVCYVFDEETDKKQVKFVEHIDHSKAYPVVVKEKDGSYMYFKNYEVIKAPKLLWKTWQDISDVVFKYHNNVGKATALNIKSGDILFYDILFSQQESNDLDYSLEYSTDGGKTFEKVGLPKHKFTRHFTSIDEYEKYINENDSL